MYVTVNKVLTFHGTIILVLSYLENESLTVYISHNKQLYV